MVKNQSAEEQPKRKQHRKKREKIVKKHSFKKNKKKFYEKRSELRKIKAGKDELRKLGLVTKEFAEKVHADEVYMIQKIFQKLVEHDSKGYEEMLTLFELVDSKCCVDLRKMTDSYVQLKLHKLFKLLKLQHSKQNVLEYKKRSSEMHEGMSFVKLFLHLAKQVQNQPDDDSSITDSSDQDGDLSQDEDEVIEDQEQEQSQREDSDKEIKQVKQTDFLRSTLELIQQQSKPKSDFDTDLDALFSKFN